MKCSWLSRHFWHFAAQACQRWSGVSTIIHTASKCGLKECQAALALLAIHWACTLFVFEVHQIIPASLWGWHFYLHLINNIQRLETLSYLVKAKWVQLVEGLDFKSQSRVIHSPPISLFLYIGCQKILFSVTFYCGRMESPSGTCSTLQIGKA